MKRVIPILILLTLGACSDQQQTDQELPKQTSEDLPAPDIIDSANQADEEFISSEQAAQFEALMLAKTKNLSDSQTRNSEQVSVSELESLSETDRQLLQEKSSDQTAESAEHKAAEQAAAAAMDVIDEP